MISIIVAIAQNGAIGYKGDLIYHLSADLRRFKELTTGNTGIMGRKTYESIGRPLPKRTNIVVSRGASAPEGTLLAGSLEEAYRIAEESIAKAAVAETAAQNADDLGHASGSQTRQSRCFVMGGGQIYAQAMQSADRLIVTHVHTVIKDADTFFPEIDPALWHVVGRSEMLHDEESGYDFEFVEYER